MSCRSSGVTDPFNVLKYWSYASARREMPASSAADNTSRLGGAVLSLAFLVSCKVSMALGNSSSAALEDVEILGSLVV